MTKVCPGEHSYDWLAGTVPSIWLCWVNHSNVTKELARCAGKGLMYRLDHSDILLEHNNMVDGLLRVLH